MRCRQRKLSSLAALAVALAGCGAPPQDSPPAAEPPAPPATAPAVFSDRTAESGLDFVHWNGMSGSYLLPEVFGSGAALLDADGDGDLDVFLVQGNFLEAGKVAADAVFPPHRPLPLGDRLFRNDLTVDAGGQPTLRFTDVTAASGLVSTGYGMGAATGDYDNDGRTDLYVTNLTSNRLFRNTTAGASVAFTDVTEAAGVDDRRWSVAALFFDYDRDGWLDLFVANYVGFNLGNHQTCRAPTGEIDYCGPLTYSPEPDRLWRNRGAGPDGTVTFEDVTLRAGLDREYGNALGAIAADFDGDGWLDLFVANDQMPNQLWMNRGDGTFVNEAALAGAAISGEGTPEASMGVDAADFDGDGDEDLLITHLSLETNTVYRNLGRGMFDDASVPTGLGMPSWEHTGFGTAWLDYDNDGELDVLAVNGAIKKSDGRGPAGSPYPLGQPNQLFRGTGGGRFEEVSARAGDSFPRLEVSRGAAFGDLDNDGDVDVVVANNSGPARLLINDAGDDRPWVGLRLVGGDPPRDRLGARAGVVLDDGSARWRRVKTAGSYASAGDPRLLLGLGGAAVVEVRVEWPSGGVEEFTAVEAGTYNTLIQGTGNPVP